MNLEKLKAYCLEKPGAYEDCPFGETPVCCKVAGRIFAQLYLDGRVTLKCDAAQAQADRERFPKAVAQAGSAQWAHWNTVYWEKLPEEELLKMLDRSYDRVFAGLPRWQQQELLGPPAEPEEGRRRFHRKKRQE